MARSTRLSIKATGVFKNLPSPFSATRYHSLAVAREGFPTDLVITAETGDGVIMGARHVTLPIHGVQFHPESIATEHGHALLKNFLDALMCLRSCPLSATAMP